MKIDELLSNQPNRKVTSGIEHPEDLIFRDGSSGGLKAIQFLTSIVENPQNISIKWDGMPALVFGRDSFGKIVLVDKHMFDKVSKGLMPFMSIKDYDISRNVDRRDLWEQEELLLPELEKLVPPSNIGQYYFGDLLWAGKLSPQNGEYSFKPNTVTYKAMESSELGSKICNSSAGIAVHSIFPNLGNFSKPYRSSNDLNQGSILVLPNENPTIENLQIDPQLISTTYNTVRNSSGTIDEFLTSLRQNKCLGLIPYMKKFITHKVKSNIGNSVDSLNNMTSDFIDYMSTSGTSSLLSYIRNLEHQKKLQAFWDAWVSISLLKMHVKDVIDAAQLSNVNSIKAYVDNKLGHEGYVINTDDTQIKVVNRLQFSAANFLNHLSESKKPKIKKAVFCFGRMNPPTLGHKAMMDETIKLGKSDSFIFVSKSHDSNKNPLDPDLKVKFIKKLYPLLAKYVVDPVDKPLTAINYLYEKGYRDITYVGGSDRLDDNDTKSIKSMLEKWNSKAIREKDKKFGSSGREEVKLSFKSSGTRNSTASDISGYSGTKARDAIKNGDSQSFEKMTKSKHIKINGKTLYDEMRKGMKIKNITEDVHQPPHEITPLQLKALETYLDRLWKSLGIDVSFTKHFLDRVNDERNGKQITIGELGKLFKLSFTKYGKKIAQLGPDQEAILNDLSTDVNVPFRLDWDAQNKELDLIAKTVMRKRNFHSPDPKFTISEFVDDSESHKHGTIAKLVLDNESADELIEWCANNNVPCLPKEKLHCTVLFSKKPVESLVRLNDATLKVPAMIKGWKLLGTALTLDLYSPKTVRLHKYMISQGGTHDYDEFIAHVSVSYDWSEEKSMPSNVPDMLLIFTKLEIEPIDEKWAENATTSKVD